MKMQTTDNQKELFVVVDVNDNIVGYRTRYECHHDTALIHRALSIVVFDTKGRILLQKRSLTKDTYPGYWTSAVGGHVGKGESYEDSAKREMKEELGIEIPIVFHLTFVYKYPHETEMEALFTGVSDGPFKPHPEEVDRVEFFEKESLYQRIATKRMKCTDLVLHELKLLKIL